ncbi:hypothetical protein L1987_41598 [Smallanthus sonchifolius]|uniref:Uncharacterized protein n=1 Tax=Smallanthus sonchifolius TaxID=185202 RepID=A0ACB9GUF6_9ASTR|nr:hypothetical protein L1987_41598 [Smallanthus sonchifolius]
MVSWKINLVYVPPIVTVFSVSKTIEGGTQLINKWQHIAHNVTEDLFINLLITPVLVTFNSLFLGTADQLVKIVSDEFPELGLEKKDCSEMSWIESVVYHSINLKGESIEALVERRPSPKAYFKVKSDYVKKAIPEEALEEILKWCLHENLIMAMEPHVGKMSEIDEAATPYPHRGGNLYIIQYLMGWDDDDASENHVGSIRRVYEKMKPYVSKNPREAYVNFWDLDLGTNDNACCTSYGQAIRWGRRYFKGNFKRLAMVKGVVDPTNFFWNEQSIPPLVLSSSY